MIYPKIKSEVLNSLQVKMNKVLNDSELGRNKFLKDYFTPSLLNQGRQRIFDAMQEKILEEMNDLLGSNDSFYLDNVDKVYSEVNYCGILVFNKFIDALNNNRLELFDLLRCDLNGIINLYWIR